MNTYKIIISGEAKEHIKKIPTNLHFSRIVEIYPFIFNLIFGKVFLSSIKY